MDLQAMKEAVGYDPEKRREAFASKWAEVVAEREDGEGTLELIDLFTEWRKSKGSKKSAASYKSLVTKFVATGEFNKGKSGDSQKSAINAFIWFCDELSKMEASDPADIPELEGLEELDETGEEE